MIKMSSPLLNCLNIIGSIFLYTAVCLMGIGYPRLDKITYKFTCVVSSNFDSKGLDVNYLR